MDDEEKLARRIQESFQRIQSIAFSLKKIIPNQDIYEKADTTLDKKKKVSKENNRCNSERKKNNGLIFNEGLFDILEFKDFKVDLKKIEKKNNAKSKGYKSVKKEINLFKKKKDSGSDKKLNLIPKPNNHNHNNKHTCKKLELENANNLKKNS